MVCASPAASISTLTFFPFLLCFYIFHGALFAHLSLIIFIKAVCYETCVPEKLVDRIAAFCSLFLQKE
jgi:hypothetical protein